MTIITSRKVFLLISQGLLLRDIIPEVKGTFTIQRHHQKFTMYRQEYDTDTLTNLQYTSSNHKYPRNELVYT